MVYIGVYAVVLGVALIAFYRCFDNMKGLRRNADDITRALHAGELWRDDVRLATSAIQFIESGQTFRIPQLNREVSYQFSDTEILRKTSTDAPWLVLLSKVQSSKMEADAREQVKAWRWELELQPARRTARLRPLFTFVAVPSAGSKP
jgi:hypothetical protein